MKEKSPTQAGGSWRINSTGSSISDSVQHEKEVIVRGLTANTRWKLAAWSASSLDPAGFDITADFADGRIGGRSAVNSYGGDYAAMADGGFSVGALAMTEMAGEPAAMQAESLFHALLGQANRWRIANGQLVLSGGGQDLLIFDPR